MVTIEIRRARERSRCERLLPMKAVVRVLYTAFLAFGAIRMAQATPTIQVVPTEIPGLEIVGSQSPAFLGFLDRLIDSGSGSALTPVLPYCVIIRNTGERTVVATGVRFEVRYSANGPVRQYINYITHLDPRLPHLQPGGLRLVAIDRAFSDAVMSRRWGMIPSISPDRIDEFSRAHQITISLDSVIFEGGEFVGPDVGNGYYRLSQQLAGEVAAHKAIDEIRDAPDSGILGALERAVAAKEASATDFLHQDFYTRSYVQMSRTLLRLMQQRGRQAVLAVVDDYLSRAKTVRIWK